MFFPDLSISFRNVKLLRVVHKFSSGLTLIENVSNESTLSSEHFSSLGNFTEIKMGVSMTFHHLTTDMVSQDSSFSTVYMLIALDIKQKSVDKFSPGM